MGGSWWPKGPQGLYLGKPLIHRMAAAVPPWAQAQGFLAKVPWAQAQTTSAAWGHRVKKSLAMADLSDEQGIDVEWVRNGEFEVEVATTRYPVSVRFNAFYDPKQTRLKA